MKNGQLDFLDIVSLMSFCIALQNLDLNISQEDIANSSAEIEQAVNDRLEKALADIHGHLSVQDTKMNLILSKLEELESDSRRNL